MSSLKYKLPSTTLGLLVVVVGWMMVELMGVNGQGFMLRGMSYSNGSTVSLSDIGEGENALLCTTNQTDCCGIDENEIIVEEQRKGQFYYPDGTQVPIQMNASNDGLYRGRGYRNIYLRRLSSATTNPPLGLYRCDIPDRNDVSQNVFINITSGNKPRVFNIAITSGSTSQLLKPVNLTCVATGSPPLIYRWYRDGLRIEGEEKLFLYIEQFTPEDRGYYTCEAINSAGRDNSSNILLTLEGIQQYVIEINRSLTSFNIEAIREDINSTLLDLNISASVYEFNLNSSAMIFSVFLTVSVTNRVPAGEIHEAIKEVFLSSHNATTNVLRFDGCPAMYSEPVDPMFPNITLNWPETEIGDRVPYSCPCQNLTNTNSSGLRMCGGTYTNGAEWNPVNVVEDCGLTEITLLLCQALILATSTPPELLAKALVNFTSKTDEIQALDIAAATTLIENLTDEAVKEVNVEAIDNLIQADVQEIEESQNEARASTRLLSTLSNFADRVQLSNTSNSTTFVQQSLAIHVANIDTNNFFGETLTVDLGSSVDDATSGDTAKNDNAINTMPGIEQDTSEGIIAAVKVPMTIFKELGLNKSEPQRLSYSVFTQGSLFQSSNESQTNLTLGSVVVSVRVNGTLDSSTVKLNNPIEVLFQASQLIENATDTSILCGQWNTSYNGGLGAWSTENNHCNIDEIVRRDSNPMNNEQPSTQDEANKMLTNRDNVVVHYSQPGHFGLLLDLTHGVGEPLPEEFSFALQVISYIGLVLSLLCLTIFLITYLTHKQLRTSEHGQILINMSVALVCLYVTFLIGAHAAPVPVICGISAGLLQYFMLVFFLWTAIEAFYLYRKLVVVLGTHMSKFVQKAALIAWLTPWIIVVLSVGPGYKSYYIKNFSSGFCRAIGLPFWLGTILPFVVVYTFNLVIFVLIIVSLCRHAQQNFEKDEKKEKIKFVREHVMIAFGLAILFGLGWGFGLAASGTTIHSLTLAFQIIFSIFVGCQGILFFILHGIKKQEARNQWKQWFSTITSKPLLLYSVTKAGSTAMDSKATHSTYDTSTLPKSGTFPLKAQKDHDSTVESSMIVTPTKAAEKSDEFDKVQLGAKELNRMEKSGPSEEVSLDKCEAVIANKEAMENS